MFEEYEVWRKARLLYKQIHEITKREPFARDYNLKQQIRRSAVSITSNIAEGHDRDGNKEFIQFLYISKGSASELRSQLYNAVDVNYITLEEFRQLKSQVLEISRMLYGLISSMKGSELSGQKNKKST
jgi:four helix bundle protein